MYPHSLQIPLALQICIKLWLSPLATSVLGHFLGRQGVQWWGGPVSDGRSTTFWNDWLRIVDATTTLERQAQLSTTSTTSTISCLVLNG